MVAVGGRATDVKGKYETYRSSNGGWRWRIRDYKGEVVTFSRDTYRSRCQARRAIKARRAVVRAINRANGHR